MPPKVTDVLVLVYVQISNDIILFGRGVDHIGLVLRKVDQVDTVLFRVQRSLLRSPFAVVDDDLKSTNTLIKLFTWGQRSSPC
jgi:hypothetical protein